MDGTLGEIRLFAPAFAPKYWMHCDGRELSVSENSALFTLLGTIYGGDGKQTFALPDLRGRAPVSAGRGPGLSDRGLGFKSGVETATIDAAEIPTHSHEVRLKFKDVSYQEFLIAGSSNKNNPGSNYFADAGLGRLYYGTSKDAGQAMDSRMLTASVNGDISFDKSGGGQPHNNMQPYLVLNYIICIMGIYPSRHK